MVHELHYTNGLIFMFPPSNYGTDIMDGAGTEAHLMEWRMDSALEFALFIMKYCCQIL